MFLDEGDDALDRGWLAEASQSDGVEAGFDCLTAKHVHMVRVRAGEVALPCVVDERQRRFSGYFHGRLGITEHLFQGRFGCVARDEPH